MCLPCPQCFVLILQAGTAPRPLTAPELRERSMSGATPVCACGEHQAWPCVIAVNEQAWSLRLPVQLPRLGATAADLEQEQCEGRSGHLPAQSVLA